MKDEKSKKEIFKDYNLRRKMDKLFRFLNPPKSFSELLADIKDRLRPENLQANYQPVMIKALLEKNHTIRREYRPNYIYKGSIMFKPLDRTTIALRLQKANKNSGRDLAYYLSNDRPVYKVLTQHGIVNKTTAQNPNNDLFEINLETCSDHQLKILIEQLELIIQKKSRIDAARKAVETKGPDGLKEAARKAAETKKEQLKDKIQKEIEDNGGTIE